jgi:hypothetical protein
MTTLKNSSAPVVAGVSLLLWFVPFVPLMFIFSHDLREQHISWALMLPFLSGISPAYLFMRFCGILKASPLLIWLFGFALPLCFIVLVSLASRWRTQFLVTGFLLACAMSWFAYVILRW